MPSRPTETRVPPFSRGTALFPGATIIPAMPFSKTVTPRSAAKDDAAGVALSVTLKLNVDFGSCSVGVLLIIPVCRIEPHGRGQCGANRPCGLVGRHRWLEAFPSYR